MPPAAHALVPDGQLVPSSLVALTEQQMEVAEAAQAVQQEMAERTRPGGRLFQLRGACVYPVRFPLCVWTFKKPGVFGFG